MNTKDITMEQLETLVLIRSLEEFITDEYENLESLNEVIWTLKESLSDDEHEKLVKDICRLTETGYLISDASEEDIEMERIPDVEGITPKGITALNELEQEVKSSLAEGKKIVLFENFTLFNFDVSLLGGVEMSLFKEAGGLFKCIGKTLRKFLNQ